MWWYGRDWRWRCTITDLEKKKRKRLKREGAKDETYFILVKHLIGEILDYVEVERCFIDILGYRPKNFSVIGSIREWEEPKPDSSCGGFKLRYMPRQ